MIRTLKNIHPTDGVHPNMGVQPLLIPVTGTASLAIALSMNATAVGTQFPILNGGWIRGDAVSVAFTTATGIITATLTLVGLNQFNEQVSETITFAASPIATTIQSLNAYKRIISCTVASNTTVIASTISIGTTGAVVTDATTRMRIGLPWRVANPAITAGSGAQTANGAEWIQAYTSAAAVVDIQVYDGFRGTIQSATSLSGQWIGLRYDFGNVGNRF